MSFFRNRDDHAAGSSSRQDLDPWGFHPTGEREGWEDNEDMVRLREQLSAATEELASLKTNMSSIVEKEVAVRVNRQLPILMRKIDYWIAGGRQGPYPKYELEPTPSQDKLLNHPYVPKPVVDSGVSTKKGRKRKKKGDYASKQSVVYDTNNCSDERTYHVLGESILSPSSLHTEFGFMRTLHDIILRTENHLLRMEAPTYPVFVAKVPVGMGFVDYNPADVFFLRFDDIFRLFHMKRLTPNLVRLFALNEAYQAKKEREFTPTIVIADPYYLSESKLYTMEGQLAAKEYIQNLMLANKDKDTFLLPYFPGPPE